MPGDQVSKETDPQGQAGSSENVKKKREKERKKRTRFKRCVLVPPVVMHPMGRSVFHLLKNKLLFVIAGHVRTEGLKRGGLKIFLQKNTSG